MCLQPVYNKDYVVSVKPKHLEPERMDQKVGFYAVQAVRTLFDKATGYGPNMTEDKWLHRMIFLETVAGERGATLWRVLLCI